MCAEALVFPAIESLGEHDDVIYVYDSNSLIQIHEYQLHRSLKYLGSVAQPESEECDLAQTTISCESAFSLASSSSSTCQ